MVKTAVWLVNHSGRLEALQQWVKRRCETGRRTITEKEIRRVWSWAEENADGRAA